MSVFKSRKAALMTAPVAAIILAAAPLSAVAREAAEPAKVNTGADGAFLGTIDIGESTRSVQTGTATPKTVINRKEIEERQASTIAELLDSIPGVTLLNGSTPVGSGINIRGFGANGTYGTDQKVLVMVDGATTGSEELYRIGTQLFTDPLLYKQAEVIRGTVGSFEYGSGVIGGVVRLETSDAADVLRGKPGVALNQSITGQTNGDGFVTSTTAAFMPSENFEFLANYTYREQQELQDGNGDDIENSAFALPSFLLKAGVHFGADNAHTVKVSFNQSTTADRDVLYDAFGVGNFGRVDRDTKTQTIIAGYTFKPLGNDLIDLSLLYTYANQEIDQEAVPADPTNALLNADHRYETSKITLKNASLFSTGQVQHNLRYGAEYIQRDRLDANSAPGGTDKRYALFGVYEVSLFRGFTLTPAIRWETQKIDGTLDNGTAAHYENDALMGGVSVRYEMPFGLAAFGSWAHTSSLPILDDLQVPVYMNQPERSRSWEGGLSFDRTGLLAESDRLAIKANYYDTELYDNTSYSGVSEVYLEGLEIEASYAMRNGFYADFNANIVGGQRLRTTGVIDDWTNLPANTYQLALGKRFGRTFDMRWEGVLAEERDTNGVVDTGYDVHNLRVSWTPDNGVLQGLAVRLSVENLFDTFYTPALATRPAPGRNFKLTLSTLF